MSFLVFLAGFLAFVGSVSLWSVPVAGGCGGGILMVVAALPYLTRRN